MLAEIAAAFPGCIWAGTTSMQGRPKGDVVANLDEGGDSPIPFASN